MQLKIPAHKCDRYRVGWKWSTQRLIEDWMSRGITNTHMARGFSDLYHVFARNNAFSVLHHIMVALHYSTLHRFKIFSGPGTIAHSSIRFPPHSFESSWGRSLAINIAWQQHHNRFSSKSNLSLYQHFLWKCFSLQILWVLVFCCVKFHKNLYQEFQDISEFLQKGYTFCMNWRQDLMQTNLLLFGCFWKVLITHLFFKWPLYTLQMAKCK